MIELLSSFSPSQLAAVIYSICVVVTFIATAIWVRIWPADNIGSFGRFGSEPDWQMIGIMWLFGPLTLVYMVLYLTIKAWAWAAFSKSTIKDTGKKQKGGYR